MWPSVDRSMIVSGASAAVEIALLSLFVVELPTGHETSIWRPTNRRVRVQAKRIENDTYGLSSGG